jgi:hypothetical protein
LRVIDEAKEWSRYARERFGIYGTEHSGPYFKPNMAKSLDHLDALVTQLESWERSLSEFKRDLCLAPELIQYERDELVRWFDGLLNDPPR